MTPWPKLGTISVVAATVAPTTAAATPLRNLTTDELVRQRYEGEK